MKYLTEGSLGDYLAIIYPNVDFFRDRMVPESGLRNRPDYRSEQLKLIVEFDGWRHYSSAENVLTDDTKDRVYSTMGYNVVRIPYFVQMSAAVVFELFGVKTDIEQTYPHGFIDPQALLPADYCQMGIDKFLIDIHDKFKFISVDIIKSIRTKIEQLGDKRLVLPNQLFHLIESNNDL